MKNTREREWTARQVFNMAANCLSKARLPAFPRAGEGAGWRFELSPEAWKAAEEHFVEAARKPLIAEQATLGGYPAVKINDLKVPVRLARWPLS
jgi:hypothetical protein